MPSLKDRPPTRHAWRLVPLARRGGCAEIRDIGRRIATGALRGAALGTVAGSFSGNARWGALIAAGVGESPSHGSGGA
jgi:hypothetical protein